MPIEGVSFAASLNDAAAPSKSTPQYFEMFGHRGLWHRAGKPSPIHPPGTPFDADQWELYDLEKDFTETNDLAAPSPSDSQAMIETLVAAGRAHNVLPLDDRFRARFAENAADSTDRARTTCFHAGMGHVPTEVAPDLRSRSYLIEAFVELTGGDPACSSPTATRRPATACTSRRPPRARHEHRRLTPDRPLTRPRASWPASAPASVCGEAARPGTAGPKAQARRPSAKAHVHGRSTASPPAK